MREKIISLELSNAEEDVESITGTGASDAESESEDTTGQNMTTSIVKEKTDSHLTTDTSEIANETSKTNANITAASVKKKKRKRSKKGRHWQNISMRILINDRYVDVKDFDKIDEIFTIPIFYYCTNSSCNIILCEYAYIYVI